MITCKNDRMLELLWFVGYCGEFPSQMASRIGGHPEWNRHLKYRAIKDGYVKVFCGDYKERRIRSLRLTDKGIDYIGARDLMALNYVLPKNTEHQKAMQHIGIEKIARRHSEAIALLMAHNAGAIFLPDKKPSLLLHSYVPEQSVKIDPDAVYYYSAKEIRASIEEFEPSSVAKTSRILGVIVTGHRCYCIYYAGYRRMYWRKNQEDNTIAAIDTMLARRGFKCTVFSQVIIGSNIRVSAKLAKQSNRKENSYFTLSDHTNNCFFVVNNEDGDKLLSLIIHMKQQNKLNQQILTDYDPPVNTTRKYDAVTKDGQRPVILSYLFDLQELVGIDGVIDGFPEAPLILCFDYQVSAIQAIVGPLIAVRPIEEAI